MADSSPETRMKSAYELALERMEKQGIEPPRESALTDEGRAQVAEARQIGEARLAELEILHRSRLRSLTDPTAREEAEEQYLRDRRRVEGDRDRKIENVRAGKP
jgi:hypothetical protein